MAEPQPASQVANRSVLRALSILELLSRTERPLSLAEIAAALDLPRSSALSLLRALTQREFAAADGQGRYMLASRSFEIGAAYLRSMTPVRAVEGELRHLTESLGVTSHFAILDGGDVLYLAKQDPPGPGLTLASSLGARLPALTTAVGKVQLAFSGGVRFEAVRNAGYAIDDGETATGIRCVAAPVFDSGGCCGAIGVSYLLQVGPDSPVIAQPVMAAAARASQRLGGRAYLTREAS